MKDIFHFSITVVSILQGPIIRPGYRCTEIVKYYQIVLFKRGHLFQLQEGLPYKNETTLIQKIKKKKIVIKRITVQVLFQIQVPIKSKARYDHKKILSLLKQN